MSETNVIVDIAKAVTERIRDASFSDDAVIERSYGEWDLDLKEGEFEIDDATRLHIDIVSHRTETANELASRGRLQFDVPIDIAVRQKLGQTEQMAESGRLNTEEIDRLMLVVQQVHLLFTPQRLTDFPCGVWQSTKVVAAPHQHLRELRQFTGIVRVTFRADLKIPVEA